MYEIVAVLFSVIFIGSAYSAEQLVPTQNIDTPGFRTADEILYANPDDTRCATAVFANALATTANAVSEDDDEQTIQQWIYQTFSVPDVLNAVLRCPEFQNIADDDSVRFLPIEYNFPGGRQIVVNYETQPKILKQRINLASKRNVAELNDPNPRIGAIDDEAVWTNTDPAWYAIMVVQHGTLDNFVGPDKNNTISLKYINDNIDTLYPHGAMCTSKSALANDNDIINIATHNTVGIDDDSNDYYVAGDVNLQWISYAEIALDVVITVVTFGGGAAVSGATKAARASKTVKNLSRGIKELSKIDTVKDYIVHTSKLARAEGKLSRIREVQRLESELAKLDRVKNAKKYAEKAKELEHATTRLREVDKITDASKYGKTEITAMEKNISEMKQESERMIRADKNVAQYAKSTEELKNVEKYAQAYRTLKTQKAGNIATRAWRAFKASRTGGKTLNRGARVARQSMKSGRVRDWLFQSTMRNLGKLGKLESAGGVLYGALKFAGDMYDWTETSTGDFTSGIEFKPLLLLSADDLEGQENVVNYGMWLMWAGDATTAADDDAAYLQAFDFADKFHMDLLETMDDKNSTACNVDIYVVRPVLRNPSGDNPELYYLVMNDQPWTTAE
ncbi:MAG: hypothetical protein IJ866_00775 [Alphaproteobacteria bacterium]|nr:hypothetical protein [Alphaproteobacteria bacterium]